MSSDFFCSRMCSLCFLKAFLKIRHHTNKNLIHILVKMGLAADLKYKIAFTFYRIIYM
jgi:hypothetical protein